MLIEDLAWAAYLNRGGNFFRRKFMQRTILNYYGRARRFDRVLLRQ